MRNTKILVIVIFDFVHAIVDDPIVALRISLINRAARVRAVAFLSRDVLDSSESVPSNTLTRGYIETFVSVQVVTSASPSADSLTDTTNSSFATPPFSLSPVGESQGFSRWRSSVSFEEQGVELQLPEIVPLELPEPRELTIQRQPPPRNDFGFSLRRAVIVERTANGVTQMRPVIFAEPGALVQHNNDTGLLPGDRLIEVNGINVDEKSREEIIDLIKSSASNVTVKVIVSFS